MEDLGGICWHESDEKFTLLLLLQIIQSNNSSATSSFNSQCTLSITYSKIHVEVQRIDIRQYTFYIVPMNMFHLFHIKILFMTL